MAGTIVVDNIQSDSSYASTINVQSKINFTGGVQIGGVDSAMSGMRNRVINGDFRIDQRRVGTAQTNVTGGADYWLADRWRVGGSALTGKMTFQTVADAPPGFVNSGKITVTTAQPSYNTSDVSVLSQIIEGNNLADFGWGSAAATAASFSFWVKASVTGTYNVSIRSDNVSNNYSYCAAYTVLQANTWEYKTISIPATVVGNWGGLTLSNTYGIRIDWNLGCGTDSTVTPNTWVNTASAFQSTGAVKILSTLNSTWQITGVQLEKGSVATPFEYRSITNELQLCQRYFYKTFEPGIKPIDNASVGVYGTVAAYSSSSCYLGTWFKYPVTMRAPPSTVTLYGMAGSTGTFDVYTSASWQPFTTVGINTSSSEGIAFYATKTSAFTAWGAYLFAGNLTVSSEL